MNQVGIALYPWAVADAAHVCDDVWVQAIDPDLVVTEFEMINPEWSFEQVRTFVAASIVIYCPPPDLQEQVDTRTIQA